jgi:hypothetical protein
VVLKVAERVELRPEEVQNRVLRQNRRGEVRQSQVVHRSRDVRLGRLLRPSLQSRDGWGVWDGDRQGRRDTGLVRPDSGIDLDIGQTRLDHSEGEA